MENMKSFDKRERKIKAPVVREKKVINTRSLLEEADQDSSLEDEEDYNFDVDENIED
jgi:hypothetical protein